MKHPDHICRFNDAPQSCDCYDNGWDDAMRKVEQYLEHHIDCATQFEAGDCDCGLHKLFTNQQ